MQAQSYIKEHYGEQIKLADVAGEVNLSPNYFHTMFTEVCGVTPHDYLVEYRVNMAKNLLITADLTISEIAERCGFKNQQYLTSVFKAKTGLSPTHFKREHQNTYFL
jgi:AraC-like DNA-binding protein